MTDSSRERLAQLNREYERRFGYIFIICATGKTGDEMLHALERRMGNNPDDEVSEAADEQRKIARLRLAKLLTGSQPTFSTSHEARPRRASR